MLMVLISIVPIAATTSLKKISQPSIMGNILYVGGSGPNNYTKIQDAIDTASDGDIVFVYDDSSPYDENVVIDKSIALIGEDKQTTIINGVEYNNASIRLQADGITVKGFTLTSSSDGIRIESNSCTIENNIIIFNNEGIDIFRANNTLIKANMISNNSQGLYIVETKDTVISGNNISFNIHHGINCGSDNLITLNTISDNGNVGVLIAGDNNTLLQNNIVDNGHFGVDIWNSKKNSILQNNIYDNQRGNARINVDLWMVLLRRPFNHTLNGNYWGRSYQFPKVILGCKYLFLPTLIFSSFINVLLHKQPMNYVVVPIFIPMIKFDWHPAQKPYDIP